MAARPPFSTSSSPSGGKASDDAPASAGGSEPAEAEADLREVRLRRALEHVRHSLGSLRFGQIVITVQDGVVVQIDRTEKTRLR